MACFVENIFGCLAEQRHLNEPILLPKNRSRRVSHSSVVYVIAFDGGVIVLVE